LFDAIISARMTSILEEPVAALPLDQKRLTTICRRSFRIR